MKRKVFIALLLCVAMLASATAALAVAKPVEEYFIPITADQVPCVPEKPQIPNYTLNVEGDHYILATDWKPAPWSDDPYVYATSWISMYSNSADNDEFAEFQYDWDRELWVSDKVISDADDNIIQFTGSDGTTGNKTSVDFYLSSGKIRYWEARVQVGPDEHDQYAYQWNENGDITAWNDFFDRWVSTTFDDNGKLIGYAYEATDGTQVNYLPDGTFTALFLQVDGVRYRYSPYTQNLWTSQNEDNFNWEPCDEPEGFDISKYPPLVVIPGSQPQPTEAPAEPTEAPVTTPEPTPAPITRPANPVYASFADTGIDTAAIMSGVQAPTVTFKDGAVMVADAGYDYVEFSTEDDFVEASLIDGMWVCNNASITADNYQVHLFTDSQTVSFANDGLVYVSATLENNADIRINRRGYTLWQDGMAIYYDENGALTSYSYNPTENSTVSFTADGTMQHFFIYQNDQSYNWNAERGWFYVETDADGNWVEIPCDAPEGVDLSIYEAAEIIAPKPAKPKYTWYPNNTVGLVGLSLRDNYPGLTDKWYNVVPVDLTQNGVQTFRLVASNLFYIGQAAVIVDGDNVTVQYALANGHGYVKDECVRWFTSVDEITSDFLKAPESGLAFDQTISRSKDLNGQDVALLFICNHVTYRQPYTNSGVNLTRYWPNLDEWKAYREGLNALMERLPE